MITFPDFRGRSHDERRQFVGQRRGIPRSVHGSFPATGPPMDQEELVCVDPAYDPGTSEPGYTPAEYPEESVVYGPPAPTSDPAVEAARGELYAGQYDSSGVEFCAREANLPGNSIFGVEHWWLTTPNAEGGMGPAEGGVPGHGGSDYPGKPTGITDHTGESLDPGATCIPAEQHAGHPIDPACVERELEIGRDTGRWLPWNQCHTVVDDILEKCRDWSQSNDPGYITDPDPMYRYTGESSGQGGAGGGY
jgi:hypothetical protein